MAWPTFPGSRDAPMTATLRGAKMLDRSRAVADTRGAVGLGSIHFLTSARRVERPTARSPQAPQSSQPQRGIGLPNRWQQVGWEDRGAWGDGEDWPFKQISPRRRFLRGEIVGPGSVPTREHYPLDDRQIGAPGWNGPGYIVCLVTSFNGTGVNLLTRCFLMIFTAFSTASRPMTLGCCAIVAAMVPALIAASASAMASKPTTNISFSRLAAAMAWIAPSAISSFCAKTASTFFCACRMFSITDRPLARSKSAVCTATSLIPVYPFRPSRKPLPRSRAAEVPAMPSSITTLPFPFNRLATYWAAIFPPATLSDAMWSATVTPFAPRAPGRQGRFV